MNIADLEGFMGGLPTFIEDVQAAVSTWREMTFSGEAGDGRVVAVVNAIGVLERIDIDVLARRRLDNVSLGEAIVAAVRAAEAAAEQGKSQMMDSITCGETTMGEMWRRGERTARDWIGAPLPGSADQTG